MRLVICENSADVADMVASYVVKRINDHKPTEARPFVLGCPTGSSPLITYKRLVELYGASTVGPDATACVHFLRYLEHTILQVHPGISVRVTLFSDELAEARGAGAASEVVRAVVDGAPAAEL